MFKEMIKVNSRQDILNLGTIWFNEPNAIRIGQYGVFYLEDSHYPKYFKYYESYDTHSCPNYCECSQEEYKAFLRELIDEYSEKIKKIQKVLDNET